MQVQAFCYILANADPNNVTDVAPILAEIYPQSYVHVLELLRRSDWGNSVAQELVRRTRNWEPSWVINTARGYF
jgi:hypothetical protein